jgi:RimJ/RimL family protein N-acetyltransferase
MERVELLDGFFVKENVRCEGARAYSAGGGIGIMSAKPLPAQLNLTTKRLLLRPLQPDDVDLLWPDIADPEISRLMAWDAHQTKQQTAAFIENEIARRQSGSGVTWAILMEGCLCGIVSLIGIQRTHRVLTYDKAELAYWVGRSHQRLGIMTEAGRAVLDFAFREVGLHKVYVSHFAVNDASRSLIRRLGFRNVGTQREEFQKNGVWHDHVMYELLAREHAVLAAAATAR